MMGRRQRVWVQATPIEPGSGRRLVRVGEESRELVALPDSLAEGLVWRQPHALQRVYWLESARGAHLVVQGPPRPFASNRDCPMEALDGSWMAHMKLGFGFQRTPVVDASGAPLLEFKPGFLGRGAFLLATGETLAWKRTMTSHELRDAQGVMLFSVRQRFAWFRANAQVEVSAEGRARKDLLLLIGTLWLQLRDRHRRHS